MLTLKTETLDICLNARAALLSDTPSTARIEKLPKEILATTKIFCLPFAHISTGLLFSSSTLLGFSTLRLPRSAHRAYSPDHCVIAHFGGTA